MLGKVDIKYKSYKRRERGETGRVREVRGGRRDGNPKRESSWINDKACPTLVFLMRKIRFLYTCMPASRRLETPQRVLPQNTTLQNMCGVPRRVSAFTADDPLVRRCHVIFQLHKVSSNTNSCIKGSLSTRRRNSNSRLTPCKTKAYLHSPSHCFTSLFCLIYPYLGW